MIQSMHQVNQVDAHFRHIVDARIPDPCSVEQSRFLILLQSFRYLRQRVHVLEQGIKQGRDNMSLIVWACPVCGYVVLDLEYRKFHTLEMPCRCQHAQLHEYLQRGIHRPEYAGDTHDEPDNESNNRQGTVKT